MASLAHPVAQLSFRVNPVTKPLQQPHRPRHTRTRIFHTIYDELGRVKFVTTPNTARVETQYGLSTTGAEIGTATTVIDQALKQRRSITNALGQLTRVDEPNLNNELGAVNNPNQATRYFYNSLGKMTRVQQGVQNRYFMYDSLGRMIRVKQPEQEVNTAHNTTGNPDNNSWSAGFTYDVLGNVLTSTDAKGTVITNTYDKANRVTTRTYSNEPQGIVTPAVNFFYDGKGLTSPQSPNYAKGKLTKVASSVSTTEYMTFDNFGRLTRSRQITDGVVYGDDAHPMTNSYNLAGALVEQKYPSGRIVKNEFESDGDIARISGRSTSTATEQMYATGFSYFADGKIERLKLGNGLWESAKINNRLQATEIAMGHSVGDGSLMKLNYEYGELSSDGASVNTSRNAGNIARQTVSFSGLTHPFVQTFRYDSLDRITEAIEKVNGNQTWKQTFGYDIYGNRNAFYQVVGSQVLEMNNLTLPSVDPNTNRFSINQGYDYDKNGNIIDDPANGGRSFVFNGDNKQTQVKNSSEITIGTYLYDGNGKRVKKIAALETTIFVYDGFGKLAAEYSTATPPANPTINYAATDKLGSPRVLTDKLGNVVSRRDFLPFGEEIYANSTANRSEANKYSLSGQDSVRKRFTGYEKDLETGLDFAEARYYQNQHGRFTAVDPLLASGKSDNPQSFNRYIYTMNRPLILTDPLGLQASTSPTGAWYANPNDLDRNRNWHPLFVVDGGTVPDGYSPITETFNPTTNVSFIGWNRETKMYSVLHPSQQLEMTFSNAERALNQLDAWRSGGGLGGPETQSHNTFFAVAMTVAVADVAPGDELLVGAAWATAIAIEAGKQTTTTSTTMPRTTTGTTALPIPAPTPGPTPCGPCRTVSGRVVPVGTIGYRPLDNVPPNVVQHGVRGPHHNIYEANQAPLGSPQPCRCFWVPRGAVPPPPRPDWIPIEPFVP